jgi:PhoU domain-containing protein
LRTLACQGPVASDLRLVAGLLYVNEHLERMGDLCVNLALEQITDPTAVAWATRFRGAHREGWSS